MEFITKTPVYRPMVKRLEMQSLFFKKYTAPTFTHLEHFAQQFRFKIVDRYTSFDKSFGMHMPTVEVCHE